MGAADLVPGVSGGTVAFITGIYEELLLSLRSFDFIAFKEFFSLHWGAFFKRVRWKFLLPLILGALFSVAMFSSLISGLLNNPLQRSYLYAGFSGLIFASFIFCWKHLKDKSFRNIFILLLSALVAFYITTVRVEPSYSDLYHCKISLDATSDNYSDGVLRNITLKQLSAMHAKGIISDETEVFSIFEGRWGKKSDFIKFKQGSFLNPWLMLCGALAICAMLLPGISGSYILHILGSYTTIISALAFLFSGLRDGILDFYAIADLVNLGMGVLLGLLFFVRIISWLFQKHHQLTISILLGFMLGAVRSVWPFWTGRFLVDPLRPAHGPQLELLRPILPTFDGSTFFVFLTMMATFILVFLLDKLAAKKNTRVIG